MVVDASGNVGIGTTTPASLLNLYSPTTATVTVSGDTLATTVLATSSSTVFGASQLNFRKYRGTTASPVAVVSGDNVGTMNFSAWDGSALQPLAQVAGIVETFTAATDVSGYLRFTTRPTGAGASQLERMRITSAGNVGIGVNSPAVKLSVADTNCIVESIGTGGFGAFQAVSSGTNTAYMFFKNAGGEKGRIRADDNGDFYILNGTSATARMLFSGSTGRAYMIGSGSRGQTGYVLTTPNDSISNAIRASGYVEYSTDVGAIGTSYFLSDISLKENIAPSTVSSADIINEFEFVSFDWKEGSGNEGHVNVGVIAQQLQGIDPRLVNTLSDGKMSVSEPALLAHLAKALQEALSEISSLKTRIAALETK
jgi:hypothetical protein